MQFLTPKKLGFKLFKAVFCDIANRNFINSKDFTLFLKTL